MTRLLFLSAFLLFFPTWAVANELAQAKDPAIQTAIEGYREAWIQLQENCELASSYQWARWYPDDIAAAMTEEPPAEGGELYVGIFNKRKDVWRISRIPTKPPSKVPQISPGKPIVREPAPLDQLFNKEVYFDFNPSWGGNYDSGSLSSFSQNSDILNNGGCVSNAEYLSPLNPLPGCNRDIFCAEANGKDNYQVDFEVTSIDSEHTLVKTMWRVKLDGKDYTEVCETSIWTAPTIPVVESITLTTTALEKQAISKQQIEKVVFRDFRRCGNYQVAANVRHVLHRTGFKKMFATDWKSLDLGSREPLDSDFEIVITSRSRIFGMKSMGDVRPEKIGPSFLTLERTLPNGQ